MYEENILYQKSEGKIDSKRTQMWMLKMTKVVLQFRVRFLLIRVEFKCHNLNPNCGTIQKPVQWESFKIFDLHFQKDNDTYNFALLASCYGVWDPQVS